MHPRPPIAGARRADKRTDTPSDGGKQQATQHRILFGGEKEIVTFRGSPRSATYCADDEPDCEAAYRTLTLGASAPVYIEPVNRGKRDRHGYVALPAPNHQCVGRHVLDSELARRHGRLDPNTVTGAEREGLLSRQV